MVARLGDRSWSAPSAVATAGAGVGGQIGFELTDFVFILNDYGAVRTFAQAGSITLGGNVSVAAGPVGRNAEAAGAASTGGIAGVFAYSKTKGLFAGVSLEGSVLVERKDANEKLYNSRVSARELLEGAIRPPPAAEPLLSVLNSRAFSGMMSGGDSMYNDIPVYDDRHDDTIWQGSRGSAYGEGVRRSRTSSFGDRDGYSDGYSYRDRTRSRASTFNDDPYDRAPQRSYSTRSARANPSETFDSYPYRGRGNSLRGIDEDYEYHDIKPSRPSAPKPVYNRPAPAPVGDQAIARFTFDADQEGDLGFRKGDVITIVKRTDKAEDWWTGRIGSRTGIFPRYVILILYLFCSANPLATMSNLSKLYSICLSEPVPPCSPSTVSPATMLRPSRLEISAPRTFCV